MDCPSRVRKDMDNDESKTLCDGRRIARRVRYDSRCSHEGRGFWLLPLPVLQVKRLGRLIMVKALDAPTVDIRIVTNALHE